MTTLLELTLKNLQKSSEDAFPDTSKRQKVVSSINISNVKLLPYTKSNVLKVDAVANSGGHRYNCSIEFENVFYETQPSNRLVSFDGSDGTSYNIHPINSGVNDVKVKCNCMDFYYRFAQTNYQKDSLDGNPPPPYVKKTNRPDVNPSHKPGMCKHLFKLIDQLEVMRIVI
jgi:hypothetical protein